MAVPREQTLGSSIFKCCRRKIPPRTDQIILALGNLLLFKENLTSFRFLHLRVQKPSFLSYSGPEHSRLTKRQGHRRSDLRPVPLSANGPQHINTSCLLSLHLCRWKMAFVVNLCEVVRSACCSHWRYNAFTTGLTMGEIWCRWTSACVPHLHPLPYEDFRSGVKGPDKN